MRLEKIEDIVIEILMQDIDARNSDDILYFKVCEKMNKSVLDVKFGDYLLGCGKSDLPRYESVGRARRKVQAQHPELRASEPVRKFRKERALMFEEYATR